MDAFAEKHHGRITPYGEYLAIHGLSVHNDSNHLKERRGPRHWDARISEMPLEHCIESWISKMVIQFIRSLKEEEYFAMHIAFPRPHHVLTPDRIFWEMYPNNINPPVTLNADCSHRPPNFQTMVKYCKEELEWTFEPKTFEAASRRVWRAILALVTQNDYFFGKIFECLKETGRYENTVILITADHGLYHGHYGTMEKAPGICSNAVCRVPSIWRIRG